MLWSSAGRAEKLSQLQQFERRVAAASFQRRRPRDAVMHVFWPDALSYRDLALQCVTGHRQVTDAYLAGLARSRASRLATFDRGLAAVHRDIADPVPTA